MPLTVAQLVARLTADTSGFYRGMAIANSAMLRTGGLVTRVAAGVGLATLGMGIMSLRSAGNFQQSMNILEAVSGATTSQLKNMRGEAIALGADMKLPNVSARDAADAMQELAKGGLSVKNIMTATRGTLQLGLAANMGFADSATIVARALQAFHLEGTQATKVADLFTAAANKSTAEMSDIALGFQMASAQFAAGDQTIQGLTTSLALMANAGIVGSDAGTSLKTMMNRLMAPTKKAKDLMHDMGIKVYDAAGNMKPMPALISTFNEALSGMSKEQRNAALYTIFGSDAIRAARVQLNAGEQGWLKMQAAITKGGEAQKFTEARTKGLNGAMQAFGSAVETQAILLGTALLPAAEAVVRKMTEWVTAMDPNKIIGFFTALKDGVVAIYDVISGSTTLQAVLGGLLAGFLAYKTIVTTIAAVTRIWAIAQGLLNAAVAANPIVLIIAALVALGAALYIAYQRSEQFRAIVDSVFSFLKNYVPPILNAIKNAVVDTWNTIRNVTQAVWGAIGGTVTAAANLLRTILTAAFNFYRTVVTQAWNLIAAVTTAAWNIIKAIVVNTIGVITGRISAMTALRNIVSAVWNGIKAVTVAAWNAIKAIVKSAVGQIPGIISAIAGAAGAAAASIGSAIVSGILGGISGLAGALKDKLTGMIGGALGGVKSAFGIGSPSKVFADEVGKPLAEGIILGFLTGSATLPEKMAATLKTALERGKEQVDAARDRYSSAFSQLASDALSAFDAITQRHLTPTEMLLNKEEAKRQLDDLKRTLAEARAAYAAMLEDPDATAADRQDALRRIEDAEWNIRRVGLERQAEQERVQYEARRALQKRHLEEQLSDLEAALMKHPEKQAFYQNKIIALLRGYGVTYKSAGLALGRAFAQGMRESFDEVEKTAQAIAALIARYLKLRSPAQTGPLSDLDSWWKAFGTTLVSGLDISPVRSASAAIAGAVGTAIGPSLASDVSMPARAGVSTGNTYVFEVQGSLIHERELGEVIRNILHNEASIGRPVTI